MFSLAHRFSKKLRLVAAACLTLILLDGGVLLVKWPFHKEHIANGLENFALSRVKIKDFHPVYFPSPGFVAYGITVERDEGSKVVRLATVAKMECRENWSSIILLRHRVSRLDLESLHVVLPSVLPQSMHLHSQAALPTTVIRLVADGALLEIMPRNDSGKALGFSFPKLVLGNVEKNKPVALDLVLHNRELAADLSVTGHAGPLSRGASATPAAGRFEFHRVDLHHYPAIGGLLSANGLFSGILGHASVEGRATIENFQVSRSKHPFGMTGEFATVVDGVHGNVSIQKVVAHFLSTTVRGSGNLAARAGQQGKTLQLTLRGQDACVEDFLWMFGKRSQAPLSGPTSFQADVLLPPGTEEFVNRLQITGHFAVNPANFLAVKTRAKVNELSERARGHRKGAGQAEESRKPEASEATLEASAQIRKGIAHLVDTTFRVPGAIAHGGGTFNMKTTSIDFAGKLSIDASLSKAVGGWRSILLLPLDPLFRKKGAGAVLPFRMTGTSAHPKFKVSLR